MQCAERRGNIIEPNSSNLDRIIWIKVSGGIGTFVRPSITAKGISILVELTCVIVDTRASVEVPESHLPADHMPVAPFRGKEHLESITVSDYRELSTTRW
jgi:hypothetical protein